MLRPEFVQQTYYKATGKPTAPASGTKKYNQIIQAAKYYTKVWNEEPYTDWPSTYDFRTLATVTATDTFNFTTSIKKISQQAGDYIRIVKGDSTWLYTLVPADRLYEYRNSPYCAVVGQKLRFSRAFETGDDQIGGTIVVPSYGYVEFPEDDTTQIPIDIPEWLVAICAAEFIRNDLVRKGEYPNLVGEARELMAKMKENAGIRVDEPYMPNLWSEDVYTN